MLSTLVPAKRSHRNGWEASMCRSRFLLEENRPVRTEERTLISYNSVPSVNQRGEHVANSESIRDGVGPACRRLFVLTKSPAAQIFLGGAPPAGKWEAQPSPKNGEWPGYNADIRGTRYSPLDQINGTNFNKLEIAWRFKTDNLGPRPEYKLEGTPIMVKGVLYSTAGVRRSVVALDAKTGEVIWTHSLREGKRAVMAPRQLSGRGVSYWTDGRGDERIVYVTTGYRLVELNAKTGAMISSFGTNGVVDLKVGVTYGNRQPIDLETGEIGVHSTPAVVKDIIIIGSSMREGATVVDAQQHEGAGARLRCPDWQAALDVQHDSTSRRIRQRDVGERFVGGQRQYRRLDPNLGRRRSWSRVSAGGGSRPKTFTAAIAPATTCSATHSCASTSEPASGSGTSSTFIIRSGISTTRRRRS